MGTFTSGVNVTKLFTAVIYTLAYYEHW
jgi:hypothetical protein